MLYNNNLESIVFNRHKLFRCDELVVISGYVGPAPVERTKELPMKTTVIYGMYGCDGIGKALHENLKKKNETIDNLNVLYSTIPVHAKCYIWKNKGEVVHALIGSANFSTNGLTTPLKEVLAETTVDTFDPLNNYLNEITTNSISCEAGIVKEGKGSVPSEDSEKWAGANPKICSLPLYIMKDGKKVVPPQSGVNWGQAKILSGSHVNINDAYIAISTDFIDHYPELFPVKQSAPKNCEEVARVNHRHNDNIDIIWDDGTEMKGLLEGSVPRIINGERKLLPKQISTTPNKSKLGKYLHSRLNVPEGSPITMSDFERYGRDTIDISLQGEGIYLLDFSV